MDSNNTTYNNNNQVNEGLQLGKKRSRKAYTKQTKKQ